MHIIAGLGNPGEEYERTRHNTGRIILEHFRKKNDLPDWHADKKTRALVSEGKIGPFGKAQGKQEKVMLVEPEVFMNNSGKSLASLIKSKKAAENLIVIYDDLDLSLGSMKISFDRGSGGHKGLESIIRALKTRAFVRIRIGVSPATPSGKLRKPSGEKKVIDFILGKFSPKESEIFKKTSKRATEAISAIVIEGLQKAMSEWN